MEKSKTDGGRSFLEGLSSQELYFVSLLETVPEERWDAVLSELGASPMDETKSVT